MTANLAIDTALAQEVVKQYFSGTHRCIAPAQTLKRLQPMLPDMGITRVANVTGLDRIGVPVVMVSRPNSRSVSVSQGKGLTLEAAKASGLMEAVETFHAERLELPLKLASERELSLNHSMINVSGLPRSRGADYFPYTAVLWMAGYDLISGEPVWLPYESVHTNFTLPQPAGSGYFPANTNGLASGNHLLEALSHGLCEVIERDATTLWRISSFARQAQTHIDLDTIDDTDCRTLIEHLTSRRFEIRIWDATTDVRLPTFIVLLMEPGSTYADPEFGSGCHYQKGVALMRALTEAVQVRTSFISGARDDYSRRDFADSNREARLTACTRLAAQPAKRDFSTVPSWTHRTINEDLDLALKLLVGIGVTQVVAVNLSLPKFDIPVAKVVVPGLEGAYEGPETDYVPGQRAKRMEEIDR